MVPVLHGYWRSSAVYRVRIALNLKGLAYEQAAVDLRAGDQSSDAFRALNPQGLVPALEVDGLVLTQSPAILEWLEEVHPTPPLLPRDPSGRAEVRALSALIACDIHPLNNLRVLQTLKHDFGADQGQVDAWIARWITAGFDAFETLAARRDGPWAWGEAPTLADCLLIPQVYNARRFGVDLSPWSKIAAVNAHAAAHPAFAAAHPSRQPGAEPET